MSRPLLYGLLTCALALLLWLLLATHTTGGHDASLGADEEPGRSSVPGLLSSDSQESGQQGSPGLAPQARAGVDGPRAERGVVTVRVVGPDENGLSSVFVGLVETAHLPRWDDLRTLPEVREVLETDRAGEAVYRDLPYDGSLAALVFRTDPRGTGVGKADVLPPRGLGPSGAPILGAQVLVRTASGVRLRVRAVEAETGRAVSGARISVASLHGPAHRGTGEHGSGLLLLAPDEKATLVLSVESPDGRLAWDERAWPVHVSPYARRLSAAYPLRRELGVSLTVLEPDGRPTPRPEVTEVRAAGRNITRARRATDAYGRLRITGVPYLPGSTLTLRARRQGGSVFAEMRNARIPRDPAADLHFQLTLPPEETAGAFGISGGAGGAFRGRGSGRRTLTASGGHRRPKGGVLVIVRRSDGSPAHGARVWLGRRSSRTDPRGRAYFARVRPGEYAVRVKQVGLLPLSGKVTVRGEETARVVLSEARGGRVEVSVVSAAGHPLSFARLAVRTASGQPWVDIEDAVQRVDPFTDHEGRRVLRCVEPGWVTVRARWGGREGSARIEVASDEVRPVEIVVSLE